MAQKSNYVIDQIQLGPMENFIYFVGCPTTKEMAVIDPAWDANFIFDHVQKKGFKLVCLLLTHGHYDHADAADEISNKLNIPVYISKFEADFYRPETKHLKNVEHDEIIKVGALEIKCLHTPGHTPGCQCFLLCDKLFTGDTLFVDAVGRWDLPGGSVKKLFHSLYHVLGKLPDNVTIYPGHGYGAISSSTIAEQKITNPYLQAENIQRFLKDFAQ